MSCGVHSPASTWCSSSQAAWNASELVTVVTAFNRPRCVSRNFFFWMSSGSLYRKSMISLMVLLPSCGRASDSSFTWIAFSFSERTTRAMFSSRSSWKKESLLFRRISTGLSDCFPIAFSDTVTDPHSIPNN